MQSPIFQRPVFWQLLSIGLLIPALFSYLGFLPLDTGTDEPRRALVALEMILSGDYLTPTLNGELYFNKPPLYNWLIAASFHLFGNYSSFALRFPMAVSLVLYGLTIYLLVKPQLGARIAFAAALMLVTNTRILLYDSMLGLIDITFSWLTYAAFILVYHFDRKKNYWALFLTTYLLTALGFMMKGLPSIVFQGLTLLAYFLYTRQFRKLFSLAHFAGIGLFLLIIGSYYLAYFDRNNIPPEKIATVLFDESAKRTVVQFGIRETLLHMLTFPFEMLYHYAPWMFLVILLFRKGVFQRSKATDGSASEKPLITGHPFILFNALIFLVNFVIYWSSPQVYARYLLMLLPLLFTVFAYVYYERTKPTDWRRRGWEGFLGIFLVVLTIGSWVPFFHPETKVIPGLWWKCGVLFAGLAFIAYHYIRQPEHRLIILIAFLAMFRNGFNWLVIPPRLAHRQEYKDSSERIAKQSLGHPLYGYKQTIGSDGQTDVNSFHIEVIRSEILRKTDKKLPNALYIADSVSLWNERYQTLSDFFLYDRHPAKLIRF
ncbi:ArnT family glycosyltransferase [Larkinella terrae]|uniref:Phospholipid carrier-dependent glycosyltransferase n=1 Tax=Larkinella terrae TaxID=2025311 RepID=A0A7K0ELB2_9BACT|nr:glycosyltransferase family 39 protein [Larkinella terrae]MRS62331.1 phospholipid carrier-dependent glycosyltransferase [Larkinella terrae]